MKALYVFAALLISLVCLQVPIDALAQNPTEVNKLIPDSVGKLPPPPMLPQAQPQPKRFGRAAWQLGVAEATPFIFNTISGAPYAKVTFKSIGYNLNPTHWAWDKDIFQTNQFGHPYHGNLYYSAFRTNGYSFWQSAAATAAGSYLWETFGENEAPSPNDFVNTTFGGVVLGEMTHRLANRLVNNRTTGFKRTMTEVAAFVINPMNGLNRIIDGKWGKRSSTLTASDSTIVSAEFDLGARSFNSRNSNFIKYGQYGWFARAKLIYGNRYEDFSTPFSNMYISAEFGRDDSSAVNNISAYGSLAGWEIRSSRSLQHLLILSANYDYIKNEAFFYGGQSVKLNLFSQWAPVRKFKFTTTAAVGAVVLGAVPDPYLKNGRNYAYGSGVAYSGGGGINFKDRLFLSADYRGALLYTLNGNESHYFLHTVTGEVRYAFKNGFSIATEPGYFVLRGVYKEYPNFKQLYPFTRISARYSVNL
ncbi:DUF3943 domain-containing protein [Mucilaginibacter pallidiroseus]|uniref:DUF3943 domain-containing protein n=1 Tax=Mucilaginibacter pallidiroseus TaxID=2599295 RepID=A0A563UG02_9SPHI|nr:DUF3943 domain-containing protein [Mucilaginibacter pallidiroseus]TWR30284.1 DUF3943 domain-containing protein [Mucilaginibacter pallidiroseus]